MNIGDITPRDAWKTFPRMALYHVTDQLAHQAATSSHNDLAGPTPEQKESGDYVKGHVTIAGLPIAIENPQWSTRNGVDADGKEWSVTMLTHYGYVEGSLGADGDEVDVILMPRTEPDFIGDVYVITQNDPQTGLFDEHKVVIGAIDAEQAIAAYHANYSDDWQGFGDIDTMSLDAFKDWLMLPPDQMIFDSLDQGIAGITDDDVNRDPLGVLGVCAKALESYLASKENKASNDVPDILPFPTDEMDKAFYHSSRNSKAIATGYQQQYLNVIEQAQAKALPHVETPEQQKVFNDAKTALMTEYLQRINSLMSARSGVYSGFMAGRDKLNIGQVERRGNAFDKVSGEFNNWVEYRAPNTIYNAVRAAMNDEQRQRERQQQQDAADAVVDQAAMDLWGLLTSTLPTKFAGGEVKAIGFSRDGLPSSLTIGGGWDPIKFTSLYKNKPYSVETLVNRLKAKGFDVPTKASQIKKAGSEKGTPKAAYNPDYKTITMDEWKKIWKNSKRIDNGQRQIWVGSADTGAFGWEPVNVVKSLAAFDSIGSELEGITDQDIQDDPLAVLDLCLAVFDMHSSVITPTGRDNTVKTAKGTKIGTKFMVIEADQLITSHDANGKENPLFPQELQPRDRSREASQAWVQKVAANLDPDSLGRTGRADSGAPIIGNDRVVESGNGRSMAIKLAYERGTAEEYRQFIIDDADYFGLDPNAIEAMNQPVLVRVRTTAIDRQVFTVEANQDDKLTFSATERARSDAKRLDANLIAQFAPGEDGDLLIAANQQFIQGFLKSLGDTESAQYMTTDGKPTKALVDRIKAAVFSKAYNDDRLLEMMADETKPEIQNVLNALGAAAPRFIEAQAYGRMTTETVAEQVVDGIEQSLDQRVVDAVVNATNVLLASRAVGQDITEYVRQQGLFEDIDEGVAALAVFLAKNGRSAKRMGIAFKAMADFVKNDAIDQTNNGLFGEPMPPSMVDVVAAANHRLVSIYGDDQGSNIGLFDGIESDLPAITDDDVERDPLGVLDACLNTLQKIETEMYLNKEPIDAARFDAGQFAAAHDDPNVTPAMILASFPNGTEGKMRDIENQLAAIGTTGEQYKINGVYMTHRKKVHEDVLFGEVVDVSGRTLSGLFPDDLTQYQPTRGNRPKLILLGGRGGSGKSKFEDLVYDPKTMLVLDADAVKKRLPEYVGWNANQVHTESTDILDIAMDMALAEGLNVCWDTTMRYSDYIVDTINRFKEKNYLIEAHYMHLPRQEAARRAVSRFLDPDSQRYVPIQIILDSTTNEATFDSIKGLVDAWSFRDNNVARGEEPILISENNPY